MTIEKGCTAFGITGNTNIPADITRIGAAKVTRRRNVAPRSWQAVTDIEALSVDIHQVRARIHPDILSVRHAYLRDPDPRDEPSGHPRGGARVTGACRAHRGHGWMIPDRAGRGAAMDPVTLIVAALAAGAASGVGDTASTAIKDGYYGLKRLVAA